MDKQLVGAWALLSFQLTSVDGARVIHPFGEKPKGLLIYTLDGFMSVALHSAQRMHFASDDILSGTAEEFTLAMKSFSSYAGQVQVLEPGTLQHIIEHAQFPNWVGHVEKRSYRIEGDSLILTTPEFFIAGAIHIGTVVFKRRG